MGAGGHTTTPLELLLDRILPAGLRRGPVIGRDLVPVYTGRPPNPFSGEPGPSPVLILKEGGSCVKLFVMDEQVEETASQLCDQILGGCDVDEV